MENNLSLEQLPKAVFQLYEKLNSIENILLNQSNQPESDQLLTIQQAGEYIKLTPPTIYGLVSKNTIPYSKKGKRLYFSKLQLMEWIQQGRRKTIDEVNAEANTYIKKRGGKTC